MTATSTPAFDPASADAALLAAYEKVRQARAYYYQFDGDPFDPVRDAELTAIDSASHDDMAVVEAGTASTAEGVRTRLQLLLPGLDCNRWLDRALMEQGLLAVHRDRDALDGHGDQILRAAMELLHLDWTQALAAYEEAAARFALALKLKEVVEQEEIRLGQANATPFLSAVSSMVDTFENKLSDADPMERMIRTLVPSHEALGTKLSIILREGEGRFATPWIARDVQFLAGLCPDTPSAPQHDPQGAN